MKRFRWLAPLLMLSTCATAQFAKQAGGSVVLTVLDLVLFALLVVWLVSLVPGRWWTTVIPRPLERPSPWTGDRVPAFKPGGVRIVARWFFRISLFAAVVCLLGALVVALAIRNDPPPPGSQAEMVMRMAWIQALVMAVITGLGAMISGSILLAARRAPPLQT